MARMSRGTCEDYSVAGRSGFVAPGGVRALLPSSLRAYTRRASRQRRASLLLRARLLLQERPLPEGAYPPRLVARTSPSAPRATSTPRLRVTGAVTPRNALAHLRCARGRPSTACAHLRYARSDLARAPDGAAAMIGARRPIARARADGGAYVG